MVIVQLFCWSQSQLYLILRLWCTLQSTALIYLFQQTKGSRKTVWVMSSSQCFPTVPTLFFGRLFGALADMLIRWEGPSGSNQKCHYAAVINFSSTEANSSVTAHHLQVFKAQEINETRIRLSWSWLRLGLGLAPKILCSHLSLLQSSLSQAV